MKRIVVGLVLAQSLLVPASVADAAGAAVCARYGRQIAHFEGMVDRAKARENELWTARTQQHVDRLRAIAEPQCPQLKDGAAAQAEAFADLLKFAGRAALTYFTFGAF